MQGNLSELNDKKSALIKLGYREGEVNAFIHEASNGTKLQDLSLEQLEEVIDYLESYISFAKKSYKLVVS